MGLKLCGYLKHQQQLILTQTKTEYVQNICSLLIEIYQKYLPELLCMCLYVVANLTARPCVHTSTYSLVSSSSVCR